MPRIPRVRGLASLPLTASRSPFLAATRSISSTSPARALGDKLWKKGENPLPEDPYTQRAEPQETSGLPEETRPARVRIPNAVRNSRLALPPKRSEATPEKELSNVDPTYVPATSLEELEQIDTLKTWWEQPGHWGEESTFKGFAPSEKLVDPNVVELYLRRVVVEVLALRQTGKFSELATKSWSEGTRADLDAALAIQIDAKDGGASLKGDALAVAEQVAGETEGAETPERVSAEEAAELVQSWDPSWKSLSLDDEVRFAIRKRMYQLTGILIPDAKLGAAKTVGNVLAFAVKQPKPKKLFEVLSDHGSLQELSNVKLHSRKIGPVEKETTVGRWKVIEEELKKRGLPVTGTDGLPGHKEREWMRGEI